MKFLRRLKKSHVSLAIVIAIVLCLLFWWFKYHSASAPGSPFNESQNAGTSTSASDQSADAADPLAPTAEEKAGVDQAASLYVVVNKGRILPSTYVPANLVVPSVPLRTGSGSSEMHVRSDTAAAMEKLFAGAKQDGLSLMLASGYRSYNLQIGLYNGYVKSSGQAYADASSARAGHSEHQTGLGADLEPASRKCEVDPCFAETPEGKWLADNAYKYGFIIRYQSGKDSLTGYEYEPWHVRYLGVDLATKVYKSGKTLEQYFGLPNYADYPAANFQLH
jgi:D-alanyl-D-alanine carboxypeptidase